MKEHTTPTGPPKLPSLTRCHYCGTHRWPIYRTFLYTEGRHVVVCEDPYGCWGRRAKKDGW